ncbi:cation-translocating P-type ATPase [Peristeroidobacter soli]|uniref:cation-translocating P-type ATPase n=1 Tax=Peristeroidobacter soli TaxID=2497877 RepID=UPI00101C8D33|nr:cation-translocating P-type ATPase [Peristeroidobacter soli]
MNTPDASPLKLESLSQAEAARRLSADGPNELPGQGPRSLAGIAREVLTEPMFLLLIAAAAIYVVLGDVREATILAASIVVVVGITVLQERRTEQALSKLRDLSSPRALVIRDGEEKRIAGRDVVAGDLVLLREGDRVPADGVMLDATALSVDESILTGESLPVEKLPSAADEHGRVYSGSLVVQGYGTARVTATGARTEIGKIGGVLKTLEPETTALFGEVHRLVRWVATAALILCAAIAVIYSLSRHDWLAGVLAGITVAMSVLPEEFPLVLTVFLAMGAWRISRVGVLTRRMPALESIGAATLLAVDKTGTLTENRMQVIAIETRTDRIETQAGVSITEDAREVLGIALAASERAPFDPMEKAIHAAAQSFASAAAEQLRGMNLIREYDLTPELLAVTHVWQAPDENQAYVAVKGAPETVLALCHVESAERAELMKRVNANAQRGLRILGVARGTTSSSALPETPRDFELRFLGFVCLADPLRDDVPATLAECKQAGIRVVMITGDHPGTALAIATQAGFDVGAGVLTGADIETLDDETLRRRAREVNIYARSRPEHKLRLVQAFKADGNEVVMTGDGVNDAPALKAAHVGVAMGGRGTDVAREAASLVLVDDDFRSLVAAVRLGRRIYTNIRHAMSYIVSVHIPIAGMGLVPVLLGWPLLLFPVHVLFLEFVIDPACAFVFEADPESDDVMKRPPRPREEPLFSSEMLKRSIGLGTCVMVWNVCVYGAALQWLDESSARALVFVSLVLANVALIFVSRSRSASVRAIARRHNNIFWIMAALASVALACVIYIPGIAAVFRFTPPQWEMILAVALATVALVLVTGRWLRVSPSAARP